MFSKKTVKETTSKDGGRVVVEETIRTVHTDRGTTTTTTVLEGDFSKAFKELGLDEASIAKMGGQLTSRSKTVERSAGSTVVKKSFASDAEFEAFMRDFKEGKITEISQVIDDRDEGGSTKPTKIDSSPSKPKKQDKSKETESLGSSKTGAKLDTTFQKEVLDKHNFYRKKHGAPALELSSELCKFSQEWADELAQKEQFQHRPNCPYGENIYMQCGGDESSAGTKAVESWYSEIQKYRFGGECFIPGTGHFTQVVWAGSKKLGVARSRSRSGRVIVVANYDPPGNMLGQFSANVKKPK